MVFFSKILQEHIVLDQFDRTVKGQYIQDAFYLVPVGFLRSNTLIDQFKFEKIFGLQKLTGKVLKNLFHCGGNWQSNQDSFLIETK